MEKLPLHSVVEQLVLIWWRKEKEVGAEQLRKWMQPFASQLYSLAQERPLNESELLDRLVTEVLPEGYWQGAVALNQILQIIGIEEVKSFEDFENRLQTFMAVWNKQPTNLSALIGDWKKRVAGSGLSKLFILETLSYDPSKPSFFDPAQSKSASEFFLNVMRYEFGVDVEEILRPLKEVVGEYTDEVLRLIDVDLVVTPEQLRERVERALEILALAKEQGLEIGDVVSEWDRLADEGGERLEKLPMAVRRVAEQAVKEVFTQALIAEIQKAGIPVIPSKTSKGLFEKLYSADLVSIEGGIKFAQPIEEILKNIHKILLKASPSSLYTLDDVEKILTRILDYAKGVEEIRTVSQLLSLLSKDALDVALNDDVFMSNLIKALKKLRHEMDIQTIAEAVSKVTRERVPSTPEELIQAIYTAVKK